MTKKSEDDLKSVKKLKGDIENWRITRDKIGPMPKDLWKRSISMAEKIGVGDTARALGLGYTNLKSKMRVADKKACASLGKGDFIEVTPIPSSNDMLGANLQIEVERRDGASLRVQNADTNCALQLVASFLGQSQ